MDDRLAQSRHLLELEYSRLRDDLNDIENRRFSIKGWLFVAVTALVGFSIERQALAFVLVGVLVTLGSAEVEARYLERAAVLGDRRLELEAAMESARRHGMTPLVEAYVFGATPKSAYRSGAARLRLLMGTQSHAGLQYVVLLVVLAIAGVLAA